MRDNQPPGRRCDDGSHRILSVTLPHAEALLARARLVNALGADRVSPLFKTEVGWEVIICRRCIRQHYGERLAS